MVRLEKIDKNNYIKCMKLEPHEQQKSFVATNEQSLAQAYISTLDNEIIMIPYAVYNDEDIVGFIMLEYFEEKGEMAYEIGRLMIDKNHQGKGYGRAAMQKAIEIIKTFPHGPAKKAHLSYMPENNVAKQLYFSLGFEETGEMDGDEVCAALEL